MALAPKPKFVKVPLLIDVAKPKIVRVVRVLFYEGSEEWVHEALRQCAVSKENPMRWTDEQKVLELDRLELTETDGDYKGVLIDHVRSRP